MNRIPYRVFKNEHLEPCPFPETSNPNKYLAGVFVTGVVDEIEDELEGDVLEDDLLTDS